MFRPRPIWNTLEADTESPGYAFNQLNALRLTLLEVTKLINMRLLSASPRM